MGVCSTEGKARMTESTKQITRSLSILFLSMQMQMKASYEFFKSEHTTLNSIIKQKVAKKLQAELRDKI